MKHDQVLGKELATSEKPKVNRQNTNTKKKRTFDKRLNISTSKPLQHANLNLEFGKKPKI